MTEFDPLSPDSYHFWAAEHVRFADLDMMGHVNNKAFVTYYETGRVAYMTSKGLYDGLQGGMALVRLELDYRKEIRFPASLRLGVRLCRVGNSSITLACAIFDGETCASTSKAIAVRFDAETRRSTAFTDAERAGLEADL
jgi:acyl-CoA thioester hydrolase